MSEPRKVHIMVDIETTDVAHTAGIWQIGAVVINEHLLTVPSTFIHTHNPIIVMESESGYTSSLDTLKWQLSKNYANWTSALEMPIHETDSVRSMLNYLVDWLSQYGIVDIELYARGSFDFNVLRKAFETEGMEVPWKYYQENDQRTLSKFTDYDRKIAVVAHNAWMDAVQQAKVIYPLLEHFGLVPPVIPETRFNLRPE